MNSAFDNIEDDSDQDVRTNPDLLPAEVILANMHPTPEQLFIRVAIETALMNSQRKLWDLYAYDKLTYVEIGRKLKISESAVRQRVKTIEKQIIKWCNEHYEVYETLMEVANDNSTGC